VGLAVLCEPYQVDDQTSQRDVPLRVRAKVSRHADRLATRRHPAARDAVLMAAWTATPTCRRLASRLKPRIQRHPAIDKNAGAMDVIGVVRGEPHGCPPDVIRLADAFIRNKFH